MTYNHAVKPIKHFSKVKRFGSLDRLSAFPFEGKIKHVVNDKAGTRNFGEQIANRLIHFQTSKDLARDELKNQNGDYSYILQILLNEPCSYQDGNYSFLNSLINNFELNCIVKFLKLKGSPQLADFKVFCRKKLNNNLFYADAYDRKHKRQSSVCKWRYANEECYGIIHKFVEYEETSVFIASKFSNKQYIHEYYKFSDAYQNILNINTFGDYFPLFDSFTFDEKNLVISTCDTLLSTCVATHLDNSNLIMVTPVIGFEHD